MALHVAVTGSSGLIGSALVELLTTSGHQVTRLVRWTPGNEGDVRWDPEAGIPDLAGLEGVDAVVHLAGENIASGRWTLQRKAEIRCSRVEGTRRLCESLARLARPPKVLVSASAIGYYGDRGDERLLEDSPPGTDFLARLCYDWEAATEPASRVGIRVVQLRIGIVLTPLGGALKKMLLPFKLGLGGKIGSGSQFMSWISLDDLTGAIWHTLGVGSLEGPVNAVAPNPVTNSEFTRTFAGALRRPALVPVPAFAARLVFGEMADVLLLSSTRVVPARLLESGYRFRHQELEGALADLCWVGARR